MTPSARIDRALLELRWSLGTFAEVADVSYATVKKWRNGRYAAPEAVLAWLDDLAAYVRAHPVPERPTPQPDGAEP